MNTEWVASNIHGHEQRFRDGYIETRQIPGYSGAVNAAFIEELIKRSGDAEQVLQDSGRIRFQRAIQAAVELYIEQQKEGE